MNFLKKIAKGSIYGTAAVLRGYMGDKAYILLLEKQRDIFASQPEYLARLQQFEDQRNKNKTDKEKSRCYDDP